MQTKLLVSAVLSLFSLTGLAANPPMPVFRAADVDTNVGIGYGVVLADINGDKKPDIILADKNVVVWYQNPGWQKHVIAEKLTQLDHVCIAAADIDGDGEAELAAGAGWNPNDTLNSGSVHYLIPSKDRLQKWEPVTLPHEPTVHRMRWRKIGTNQFDLVVVPLHGRGNRDGQGDGVKILAYKMPADPKAPWTTELVDDTLHMTHNFELVQWDKDPEQEILVASKEGVFLFDYATNKWSRTQLVGNAEGETAFKGAGEIRTGKLPGGKRYLATVEPMHGNAVVIYTEPGKGERFWRRHELESALKGGHALGCGDFIGLGADQLIAGWREKSDEGKVGLLLFSPLDKEGKEWKKVLVDDNGMACEDVALADLNGDGRLDIVASGRATKNLKIYFNEGITRK